MATPLPLRYCWCVLCQIMCDGSSVAAVMCALCELSSCRSNTSCCLRNDIVSVSCATARLALPLSVLVKQPFVLYDTMLIS
jgi:hypothetical protein